MAKPPDRPIYHIIGNASRCRYCNFALNSAMTAWCGMPSPSSNCLMDNSMRPFCASESSSQKSVSATAFGFCEANSKRLLSVLISRSSVILAIWSISQSFSALTSMILIFYCLQSYIFSNKKSGRTLSHPTAHIYKKRLLILAQNNRFLHPRRPEHHLPIEHI